ncbi:MAG: NrdH-redoxin [Chloroflexi bacterium]|nr:NrdH-redoxin [Chloroflexota bacterium]
MQLERFLETQSIPFHRVDIETSPDAVAYLQDIQDGGQTIPTVVYGDGSFSVNPSPREILAKLR